MCCDFCLEPIKAQNGSVYFGEIQPNKEFDIAMKLDLCKNCKEETVALLKSKRKTEDTL
jgi:hypothetical protein